MKLTDKEKEQVNEWTAALRSGEYKQGTGGHLYATDCEGNDLYCCLGVGCSLEPYELNDLDNFGLPSELETPSVLMSKFEKVEFILTEVNYPEGKIVTNLFELNDDGLFIEEEEGTIGFTFPMLANLIDCIARDKEGEIYTTDDLLEVARKGIE
jgi:hypothetical protein